MKKNKVSIEIDKEKILEKLCPSFNNREQVKKILEKVDERFEISSGECSKLDIATLCLILKEKCSLFNKNMRNFSDFKNMSAYIMELLILLIRKMIVLLVRVQVFLVSMNYIMIMGLFGIYTCARITNFDIMCGSAEARSRFIAVANLIPLSAYPKLILY
ncbi:hypothetical protein NXX73_06205 [Bacteroides fragilis]|nr:hypothetical protein [Bacteroides fragilis]